jgi:hypothetical protein
MGIDIYCYTEVKRGESWAFSAKDSPFCGRNYMLFGFLGHRHCRPNGYPRIAAPRGVPHDLSPEMQAETVMLEDDLQFVYSSWVTLRELLDFDYDQVVNRERVIIEYVDGWDEPAYYRPESDDEGEWKDFTLREEIGYHFPDMLRQMEEELGTPDNVRIIYWFDQEWSSSQSSRILSPEFQSDEEIRELNKAWTIQLALFHKAQAEDSPHKAEIEAALKQIGQRRDDRWSVLLGFDPEPEVDTIPTY